MCLVASTINNNNNTTNCPWTTRETGLGLHCSLWRLRYAKPRLAGWTRAGIRHRSTSQPRWCIRPRRWMAMRHIQVTCKERHLSASHASSNPFLRSTRRTFPFTVRPSCREGVHLVTSRPRRRCLPRRRPFRYRLPQKWRQLKPATPARHRAVRLATRAAWRATRDWRRVDRSRVCLVLSNRASGGRRGKSRRGPKVSPDQSRRRPYRNWTICSPIRAIPWPNSSATLCRPIRRRRPAAAARPTARRKLQTVWLRRCGRANRLARRTFGARVAGIPCRPFGRLPVAAGRLPRLLRLLAGRISASSADRIVFTSGLMSMWWRNRRRRFWQNRWCPMIRSCYITASRAISFKSRVNSSLRRLTAIATLKSVSSPRPPRPARHRNTTVPLFLQSLKKSIFFFLLR